MFSKHLLNTVFFLFCLIVHAQESVKDKARENLLILTSNEFHGRGYTHDGMGKSADFLVEKFKNAGLKPVNDSYEQHFTFPINVIHNASLTLNGKELQYSKDFLVKPASKSQKYINKEYSLFDVEGFENSISDKNKFKNFIAKEAKEQANQHLIFPPYVFKADSLKEYYRQWPNFYRTEENSDRAIFFFTGDKLTASLNQKQDSITEFIISDEYYTEDLKIDHYEVQSEWIENFPARNVLGMVEGEIKDSVLLFSAHYDHLGQVGDVIFPGANDNASGTVMLLALAEYFAQNKPKYTIVFITFAAEEAGLLGSSYFVENPLFPLENIKFMLNLDIMGTGDDGIQVVNSTIFTKEYELLKSINEKNNYLAQIKKRGEACNSDHCPFYMRRVPAFFIYTLGGQSYYHDYLDKGETLPLTKFEEIYRLLIDFVEAI